MENAEFQIGCCRAGALHCAPVDNEVDEGVFIAGQSIGMPETIEPFAFVMGRLQIQSEVALTRR